MRLLLFLILSSYAIAQEKTYQGLVRNELNEPINNVVLTVFKAENPNEVEYILTTDDKGLFQLVLESNTIYIINTRHLSYINNSFSIDTSDTLVKTTIEVILKPAENILDEIIIKHEKPKVIIKRDTVSFDIKKYIDSNDRKLKDLVEKLPGITLQEDGTIYFRGEKITKLLVENQEFFGGGTKLGLDNIPADAIEKLEIIANYSKSNLLKNSRRTEAQVINLVLKQNRKTIVFGNIDGASGFDEFYKLHASVFQFKAKQQNNIIGDINNIAEQSLTSNESFAFANVDSELFKFEETPIDYQIRDRDYSEISNKLLTANSKQIKKNSTWDFIAYYTQTKHKQRLFEAREFFNNNAYENINQTKNSKTNNLFLRTTNYYQTTNKERLFASNLSLSTSDKASQIISNSNLGNMEFSDNKRDNRFSLGLLLEEVRPLKERDNIVYGLKISYVNNSGDFLLKSNQKFLEDIIPWIDQDVYILQTPNHLKTLDFETGVNYYKKINDDHTLSAEIKGILHLTDSNNNQAQQLENLSVNQLPAEFSSNSNYLYFQSVNRLSYRYNKNQWNIKLGSEFNTFNLKYKNGALNHATVKLAINPFLHLLYRVNHKKQVTFNYQKNIQLPTISQLDYYTRVVDYTSILIGNPQLSNTVNHHFSVNYSDFNVPKNYSFQTNQSITINDKVLGMAYEFEDINNIASYFVQDKAGFTFNSTNRFFYAFKKWDIGVRVNYSIRNENIIVSTLEKSVNNRLFISLKTRTNFKGIPNLTFSPFITLNKQRFGNLKRNFKSHGYQVKADYNFSPSLYTYFGYNYASLDEKKAFDSMDFEFRYTNKIKSLDVSIIGVNILSTRLNKELFQTSLLQMTTITESLGRRILLKCTYYF